METVKKTFYAEIQLLKDERKQLEKNRENNLLALLEKEGQIKVLQEKIISYEKEKKNQIDHADLLCKV